jgi:hypothetical protein
VQELTNAAKRGHDDIGEGITQSLIRLPTAAYTVLFAEIFHTESDITHRIYLHHVSKSFFHAAKIETTAYQQRQGYARGKSDDGTGSGIRP